MEKKNVTSASEYGLSLVKHPQNGTRDPSANGGRATLPPPQKNKPSGTKRDVQQVDVKIVHLYVNVVRSFPDSKMKYNPY